LSKDATLLCKPQLFGQRRIRSKKCQHKQAVVSMINLGIHNRVIEFEITRSV